METISVYWEPIIKTYGLFVKTDLSLVKVSFPVDRTAHWGRIINESDQDNGRFIMVAGQVINGSEMNLSLLFDNSDPALPKSFLEKKSAIQNKTTIAVNKPVELIFFQGPHFGDRYGIADAALFPLVKNNMAILASGCASASIYIVVPEQMAHRAVQILSEKFMVPRTTKDQP